MRVKRVPIPPGLGGRGRCCCCFCRCSCTAAARTRGTCKGNCGCCCFSHLENSNQVCVAELACALAQASTPLLSVLELLRDALAFSAQTCLLGLQAGNACEKRLCRRVLRNRSVRACSGTCRACHGAGGGGGGGGFRGTHGNRRRARGSTGCGTGRQLADAEPIS